MVKKIVIFTVSILTMTLVSLVINSLMLTVFSSFFPVSEFAEKILNTVFGYVIAAVSVYYGFDLTLVIAENTGTKDKKD